ncbi:MAG: hypothetical protein ABI411_08435 [Tahibacter sp.]
MTRLVYFLFGLLTCAPAGAVEVTVKNDSLVNNASGAIVGDFAVGEAAAAWLTSPCNGNIRAVQVFWTSLSVGTPVSIEDSITIFRNGTFPNPGAIAEEVDGPVMNDGVMNEFRFLDENNTVPLNVPVTNNEIFVVSFKFGNPTDIAGGTPSIIRDTDGNQTGRNGLLAKIGANFIWFNSASFSIAGDWVIRAVVDCPAVVTNADVGVTMSTQPSLYLPGAALTYTITASNVGPAAATNTSIVDIFPAGYSVTSWSCVATGGASCTSGGSGNITQSVSLPASGQVVYTVSGNVGVGTTGTLSNSATAVVGSPATDPVGVNNTATLLTGPDRIFMDGFQ